MKNSYSVKKLDKFVLKSFLGPLVLTFFIVLIILILQFLWMYVDELAGKGLEMKIVAELLFQFSLSFVPMALPLAILLAGLMTFGNMGEYNELTALKSSGISLPRIMKPLIIMIGFICVVSFFFSNNVLPYSNKKARTLLYDIRKKRPDINLQPGTFNNDIDGFSIKISSRDAVTNRLDRIYIYDHRENKGNTSVTYADSGYMRITPDETAMSMVLYNGYSYNEISGKSEDGPPEENHYPFRKDFFKEQTLVVSLSGFDLERTEIDLYKSNSSMKNITQLTHDIDSLNKRYSNRINIFFKEYNKTMIYTERNNGNNYSGSDISPKPENPVFNAKELYNSLSVMDKRAVVSKAINNIKEGSNYLTTKMDSFHTDIKFIKKYEIDWNKKFTFSFACLVFFFIGAPLGAIIRKGGLGTPAVISVLFFVIWYVISLIGEKLAEENHISTIVGMWASSYILLTVGLFLTYKASRDSVIMSVDTYVNFFKRTKDYLYKVIITGKQHNSPSDENSKTENYE